MVPTGELLKYVDPRRMPDTMPTDVSEFRLNLRPAILNHWLQFSNVTN